MPTAIFIEIFNGLCVQNLKFVSLPVPKIIGYPKNLGSPWIRPCSLLPAFCEIPAKFKVRSFIRSRDNSDWIFGWGLRTPNLGEAEAVGVEDGAVRKSVGEFL